MIDLSSVFMGAGFVLSIGMLIALVRGMMGPTIADRVVSLDTINTLVVATMVVFAVAYEEMILVDIAIVYALLSYITTLYLAKYLEGVAKSD